MPFRFLKETSKIYVIKIFRTSNGQATFKLIDKLADNEGSLSTDQFEDLSSTLDIMLE